MFDGGTGCRAEEAGGEAGSEAPTGGGISGGCRSGCWVPPLGTALTLAAAIAPLGPVRGDPPAVHSVQHQF